MTIAAESIVDPAVAGEAIEPRRARFTKAEYLDMVERGALSGLKRKVFLFRGELIEMPPMGFDHAGSVERSAEWGYRNLLGKFKLRVQCPFDAPGVSNPEPDLAVYLPSQTARRPHPDAAELLIEIADTSRRLDVAKAMEYAVRVREYWILDLARRTLLIFRNPHPDPAALHGYAYDPPIMLAEDETAAPLCEPAATVTVKELLP